MIEMLMVSIGGFSGAVVRFAISKQLNAKSKSDLPIGTLLINLTGSFLLGLLWGLKIKGHIYSLCGIGFMGAFTTFSTLQLEAEESRRLGKKFVFIRYLTYSYVGGITLAFIGSSVGRLFL
ncbi:MAG: CrcB family protein [Bacillota bacterium]|nr:CrcB family protein [Bacillota bacterium]